MVHFGLKRSILAHVGSANFTVATPESMRACDVFGSGSRGVPPPRYPPHNYRERIFSPKFFRLKFFHGRPRGMSVPKCLFFQYLEGLTEVFGGKSAGMSGRKLPLWAEFSFLKLFLKMFRAWLVKWACS